MKTKVGLFVMFICISFWFGYLCGVRHEQKVLIRMMDEATAEVEKEIKMLETMRSIIKAESDGVHEVWGQDGEFGIVQFKQGTFYWLCGIAGMTGDWRNQLDQIKLLSWAIRHEYGRLWTTYKQRGIRRGIN